VSFQNISTLNYEVKVALSWQLWWHCSLF